MSRGALPVRAWLALTGSRQGWPGVGKRAKDGYSLWERFWASLTGTWLTPIVHDAALWKEKRPETRGAQTGGPARTKSSAPEPLGEAPIVLFVVGRTGSEKQKLVRRLFGEALRYAPVHYIDSSVYVGLVRLNPRFWYVEPPDIGADETGENINRFTLGLEQFDEPGLSIVQSVPLQDFTDASIEDRGFVTGVRSMNLTSEGHAQGLAGNITPDIIVLFIDEYRLFLRSDREYLRDLLRRHPNKVVTVLNRRVGGSDNSRETIRQQIRAVYREFSPDTDAMIPLVELSTETDEDISLLVELFSTMVSPSRLQDLVDVLASDLRDYVHEA